MRQIKIVPAILSKTKEDFQDKLKRVQSFVDMVQVDVMDGVFVPNKTLEPEFFPNFPKGMKVEYHLMVNSPLEYVKRIGHKKAIYELHVEALTDINKAIKEVRGMGGDVALAISPDTPSSTVEPYLDQITHVLVMTVYPGFSGQKYLQTMEDKIMRLARLGAIVEIDGGVEVGVVKRAAAAGATMFAAASAIFSKGDVKRAIDELMQDAQI
ncbi:MAG: hypothetical protein QXN37_02030 [Candidatus Anstonellaceae archaeon]